VKSELEARGVLTGIYYPVPIHLQRAYASLGNDAGSLPATECACQRVLCLPIFPEMTDDEVRYVGETVKAAVETRDERQETRE
jgi:dTDP-4-amino-4,6-dideoxygalactose transaminase